MSMMPFGSIGTWGDAVGVGESGEGRVGRWMWSGGRERSGNQGGFERFIGDVRSRARARGRPDRARWMGSGRRGTKGRGKGWKGEASRISIHTRAGDHRAAQEPRSEAWDRQVELTSTLPASARSPGSRSLGMIGGAAKAIQRDGGVFNRLIGGWGRVESPPPA